MFLNGLTLTLAIIFSTYQSKQSKLNQVYCANSSTVLINKTYSLFFIGLGGFHTYNIEIDGVEDENKDNDDDDDVERDDDNDNLDNNYENIKKKT